MLFQLLFTKYTHHIKGISCHNQLRGVQYMCKSRQDDTIRDNIERKYQKKSLLEHILHRPDSYVGSVSNGARNIWIYDSKQSKIIEKEISFSPALYKIYDEILVNAVDNKQRDNATSYIRINIDKERNSISIENDGSGIPVIMHRDEGLYVPSMIFGHLLTSSNYDDSEDKYTGGRNGFGAKLCNLFSTEFTVETSNAQFGHSFKQMWRDNMTVATAPIISPSHPKDYTKVTFSPDLPRFNITHLDDGLIALLHRRALDIAACTRNLSIYFNDCLVPVDSFKQYIGLYQATQESPESSESPEIVHRVINDQWEIGVTVSPADTFTQTSFVNGINTSNGGQHVQHVLDQLLPRLLEVARRRLNDTSGVIKPHHLRNCLWLFVNCRLGNPTFESQSKESLTLLPSGFGGSLCRLGDGFARTVLDECSGIMERLEAMVEVRNQEILERTVGRRKRGNFVEVEKLDDAVLAGGRRARECTLILTEGDSAKTLALSGLSVVGRDLYGVYPLKGKVLNARDAPVRRVSENSEFQNLVKILGLRYSSRYDCAESLASLRYGRVMIMADQDPDGSHIKGLVINYIHVHWPELLAQGFLEQFVTPLIKAFRGGEVRSFFNEDQYRLWCAQTPDSHLWRIKYYKGLGTSTSREAKEYFTNIDRHRIPFVCSESDDDKLKMAFDKRHSHERKQWLLSWMENRRLNQSPPVNGIGDNVSEMSFSEFVDKELILFSNADNERSIPSMMDGLKTGQRKIIYTCLKRKLTKELKVAQLAGSVAEMSAYHHGEITLYGTIIGLAQDFVGSNNINLLRPVGQFGTRVFGGKDHASARYIFTQLSSLTRLIFHPKDDPILCYLTDNNHSIEPEWFAPVIPLILVNGCEGIGTGWRSLVPNFNPLDIIGNIRRLLEDQEPVPMQPWFRNFTGRIEKISPHQFASYGKIQRAGKNTLVITELPLHCWTQQYKTKVLKKLSEQSNGFIKKIEEHNTDTAVKIVAHMNPLLMKRAAKIGFEKLFKLRSCISTNEMVLFDELGRIKKYNNAEEILINFFRVRLPIYDKRKAHFERILTAEYRKLDCQSRFVRENIDGTIQIQNVRENDLIATLERANYASDPLKELRNDIGSVSGVAASEEKSTPDYGYLINLPLRSLTAESAVAMESARDAKREELLTVTSKTSRQMWFQDLLDLEKSIIVAFSTMSSH